MRSLVRAGMALAAGDSLRTAETVPGDSPMCAATVFSVALSSVFMGLSFFSGIRASFQNRLHPIADDPRTNSRAEFNNEFSEKSKLVSPSFGRLFRELKNSLARLIFLHGETTR